MVENRGMKIYSDEELIDMNEKFHQVKDFKITESINMIGDFFSELKVESFPFDYQKLRIVIVSNPTSKVIFTQKIYKESPSLSQGLSISESSESSSSLYLAHCLHGHWQCKRKMRQLRKNLS